MSEVPAGVASRAAISRDVLELQRGVAVTYLGYALKLGLPLLSAFATRAYGAEEWGRFLAAQALVLIAARVCLLGLDKAVLWAVPAHGAEQALRTVYPALLRVALNAALLSGAVQLLSGPLTRYLGPEYPILQASVWALLPLATSEILLNATMGLRRMELQVAVRETLTPLLQIAFALLLVELDLARNGLGWAYAAAHWVGMSIAFWGFRRMFGGRPVADLDWLHVSRPVMAYAWPMWLSEITNSLLLRLDTIVLTALAGPSVVGVWGVVSQFGNALRQMRRAYDPLVTAITARIALQHDKRRLADTFSYAAQMVSLSQLPVFMALVCFGDLVLPLYGPEFASGGPALIILASALLLSGGSGLAGLVVSGYGKARWMFANSLLLLGLELLLLLLLVPRFGLEGCAAALGASLCLVNLVQLLEMKLVTGSFNFTRRSRYSVAVLVGSGLSTLAAALLARWFGLDTWSTRCAAALGFCLGYAALCAHGMRAGTLRAPLALPG